MKILNLYAGIGGNRKLWEDEYEVTAVENNPHIARIYKDLFPRPGLTQFAKYSIFLVSAISKLERSYPWYFSNIFKYFSLVRLVEALELVIVMLKSFLFLVIVKLLQK